MKKNVFALGIVLACLPSTAFAQPADRLFPAIVAVESGGNPDAVGDHGRARGLVQAHRAAWAEGCRAAEISVLYETGCRDWATCRAVFYGYTGLYGAATDEQRARVWNGGPHGASKASTAGYWERVRAAMGG